MVIPFLGIHSGGVTGDLHLGKIFPSGPIQLFQHRRIVGEHPTCNIPTSQFLLFSWRPNLHWNFHRMSKAAIDVPPCTPNRNLVKPGLLITWDSWDIGPRVMNNQSFWRGVYRTNPPTKCDWWFRNHCYLSYIISGGVTYQNIFFRNNYQIHAKTIYFWHKSNHAKIISGLDIILTGCDPIKIIFQRGVRCQTIISK